MKPPTVPEAAGLGPPGPRGGKFWGLRGGAGWQKGDLAWEGLRVDRKGEAQGHGARGQAGQGQGAAWASHQPPGRAVGMTGASRGCPSPKPHWEQGRQKREAQRDTETKGLRERRVTQGATEKDEEKG